MRPLGGRLDESEMLGTAPYSYYGGEKRFLLLAKGVFISSECALSRAKFFSLAWFLLGFLTLLALKTPESGVEGLEVVRIVVCWLSHHGWAGRRYKTPLTRLQ